MRLKCNSDWNSNSTGSYSASNTFWAFFHLFSSFLGVFKSEAVKLWRIVFLLTCSHILFLIIGHDEPSVWRSHLNVGGDAASFSWRPLLGFCSFQQQNLILANMATQGYCPTIFKLLSSFTVFAHETHMIVVCPFSLKLCITPAFFWLELSTHLYKYLLSFFSWQMLMCSLDHWWITTTITKLLDLNRN